MRISWILASFFVAAAAANEGSGVDNVRDKHSRAESLAGRRGGRYAAQGIESQEVRDVSFLFDCSRHSNWQLARDFGNLTNPFPSIPVKRSS